MEHGSSRKGEVIMTAQEFGTIRPIQDILGTAAACESCLEGMVTGLPLIAGHEETCPLQTRQALSLWWTNNLMECPAEDGGWVWAMDPRERGK